jgi:hypothetical protein
LIIKAKLKTFKFLLISLSLVAILSSCNLPNRLGAPTQTTDQKIAGTVAAMALVNPTQTQAAIITPTYAVPTVTASPIPTPLPPNTPVWLAYNYTCELADGGGDMTMNLAWTDRSNSEESYKVYRDGQVIATLEPNSTFYVDMAFVATGKTLSYSVEAFNENWQASTSTITYGCK